MSSTSIKLKATVKDGMVEVKALIAHPMESGQRKDEETGKLIPKHYITDVTVTANDKTVFSSQWGGAISKNPYLAFSYQGKVARVNPIVRKRLRLPPNTPAHNPVSA